MRALQKKKFPLQNQASEYQKASSHRKSLPKVSLPLLGASCNGTVSFGVKYGRKLTFLLLSAVATDVFHTPKHTVVYGQVIPNVLHVTAVKEGSYLNITNISVNFWLKQAKISCADFNRDSVNIRGCNNDICSYSPAENFLKQVTQPKKTNKHSFVLQTIFTIKKHS